MTDATMRGVTFEADDPVTFTTSGDAGKVMSLGKRSGDAKSMATGGVEGGTGAGNEGDSKLKADQATKST